MHKYRRFLVLFCLGSLASFAHLETAQAQSVRAEVGSPLMQAKNLTDAGEYQKALAVIDGLKGVPKTAMEARIIVQMREFVLTKMASTPVSPAR